jgi:two-component system response regulator YesN
VYTLLIADDEPLECDAIELLVVRANLPLRVVKAKNGTEAVTLAKQFDPQIALLDIRMPGLDGLEAAQLIREQNPFCQIVFLTAWSTFSYAQKAIRLGASEYLVKPVQRKEVYDLLDRLIAELDQKKEDALQQKQEIRAVLNLFSREFFAALKYGRITEEAMRSYFSMQGIQTEEGIALVIGGLKEEAVESFFRQSRTWGKLQLSYFISIDRLTVLLFSNQSAKILEQIAGSHQEPNITIGSGLPFSRLSEIPYSIATASVAYTHAYKKNLPLQRYSEVLRVPMDRKTLFNLSVHMLKASIEGATEKARTIAHELIDCSLLNCDTEEQAREELFELLTVFSYEIHKAIALLDTVAVPKTSVMEQEMYLMDLIDVSTKAVQADRADRYQRSFDFVKQYLAEHLAMPLSVEDLAKLVGLNSKYFSQLCKTYLNATFVEYLTKVRMEKAYQMLGEGGFTIREVAEKTGFTDSNYFSRVFRQYHGKAPSSLKEHE